MKVERPLLIVDIDDTIFSTMPRKKAIFREVFNMDVSYEELLEDYSLKSVLPEAGECDSFFREFFSGKFLEYDEPIEHAAEALSRLASKLDIAYLTGRHAAGPEPWLSQDKGTLENLERFGFPLPDASRVQLYMKPYYKGYERLETQGKEDREFKRGVVYKLKEEDKRDVVAGVGDLYSDMLAYGEIGVRPICLVRPHFYGRSRSDNELPIKPLIAADWLEVEGLVNEILKFAFARYAPS